jgi:hypothetical protein
MTEPAIYDARSLLDGFGQPNPCPLSLTPSRRIVWVCRMTTCF